MYSRIPKYHPLHMCSMDNLLQLHIDLLSNLHRELYLMLNWMDIYPHICLLLNPRELGMLLCMTCWDRICGPLDMLLRILLWQSRYPERIAAEGRLDILIHKSSLLDLCMFCMLNCRCKWAGMFCCLLRLCKDQLLDKCLHTNELE